VPDRHDNSGDPSAYPVDPALRERLFERQTECSVVWVTRDGWPVGVVHRFVWRDDRFWVSCPGDRKRVRALRDRPQSCVIVSGEHVEPGWRDFSVTVKTLAIVHDTDVDRTVADWFYPAIADRLTGGDPARSAMIVQRLDVPGRVVIELAPTDWITYDGAKLVAHVTGRWQPGDEWDDPRLEGMG
jgi:hypothetical protein